MEVGAMKIKDKANAYLVMALLLGALVPIMLDIGTNMDASEFLLMAYAAGAAASLAFVLATGRAKTLAGYLGNWRDLGVIGAIGLLNYALFEYGMAFAERYVSASLATVVYRSYPILMLLFLPLLLRERVTRYQVVALLLGFIGLLFALSGGTPGLLLASNYRIIGLLIAVALASALASVLVKRYTFDIGSGMFIFNLANLAFFGVAFALGGFPASAVTPGDIAAILYVGVVYNVFVGVMYYSALRVLKTTFVTNIYFLSPFITFVFAYFMLGEAIPAYYIAIALLVSAGILIQKLDNMGGTYIASGGSRARSVIFDVTSAFVGSGDEAILAPIKEGGRVLAITVDRKHEGRVNEFIESNSGSGNAVLYTDSHDRVSAREAEFVRDVMGAEDGMMVFMCAARTEHGEGLMGDLADFVGE